MAYRYQEIVTFHPLVQLTYVSGIVFLMWVHLEGIGEATRISFLVAPFLVLIGAMFGRLVLRVDEDEVSATFGFLGWPSQRFPLARIDHARPVTYRPILQCGGWGIRAGRIEGERTSVYSVRGNRGLLLELSEAQRVSGLRTRRVLLGSQDPERFSAVIGKP